MLTRGSPVDASHDFVVGNLNCFLEKQPVYCSQFFLPQYACRIVYYCESNEQIDAELVLVTSTVVSLDVRTTESSEDYLRKVMSELQEFKTPLSTATIYSNANFPAGKRLSGSNSNFLPTPANHKNAPGQGDIMDTAAANHQPYLQPYHHQISAPIVVPEPSNVVGEPIGFTRNQLASIYKQALESGSTMSLSSLKSALDTGYFPSINNNQLEIPNPQQQLYQYQFYPLRAFMDKLQDNHGYKTLNDFIPQHPVAFPGSNKQIIFNPLFMAVSSFIGMALLFMFGVIFLPRLFGEFKSRVVHDELLDLTQTVSEAIDNYNSTTMRPKTRFSGAVVGIKTRPVPGVGGATRRRRKTQQPDEKTA